jgi:predicted nucleotidyltransferase
MKARGCVDEHSLSGRARAPKMASVSTAESTSVEACAAGMLRRREVADEAAAARNVELVGRARRAARELGSELGARRVWLFGSLAWGETHAHSDVDLMVEGLPPAAWLAAMGLAEDVIGVPVDVVRVEDAPCGLWDRVRREGVLLHVAG